MSTMLTPKTVELSRPTAIVDHDTFADEYERVVTRPSPSSRGFETIGAGSRKRMIGTTS